MQPIQIFKDTFLKNSTEKKSPLKSVKIFQDDKTIYILSKGFLKQETKSEIEKYCFQDFREKVYVSLVNNRDELKNGDNKILLDTYVWVADEPEHTIHYSSSSKLQPRTNYQL